MLKLFRRKPTLEQWAQKNSKITTPDRIIAEAIIASLKRDYDDWKGNLSKKFHPFSHHQNNNYYLQNDKKKIIVKFGSRIQYRFSKFWKYEDWVELPMLRGTTVNDVPIDADSALRIFEGWKQAKIICERMQNATDKITADMRRNEMAWDLVEKLLGFRRTENGALEPVVKAEEGLT